MSSILKFFRITFFLVLYFFLCMVVVTTMLQGWPVGGQMLFAFGVPVILVWWQEKRRSRKVAVKEQAEGSSETRPPDLSRCRAQVPTTSVSSVSANELAKPLRPKHRLPFRPIPHQSRTTLKSFGLESLRRRLLQRPLNETSPREWHRAHRPDHRKAGGSRLAKQLAWPAATSAGWSMLARLPC